MHFQCGCFRYPRDRHPLIIGILSVTPDSFSDSGQHATHDATLHHAEQLVAEGVDTIDIGGESSRPGVEPLSLQVELDRVMPIVETLRECGKPLLIDTYRPEMMRATLDVSADLINDTWDFRRPGTIEATAKGSADLCVIHMQCGPETIQETSSYVDLVGKVEAFLCTQTEALMVTGITAERVSLDPGFGFGKTPDRNLTMLNRLAKFQRIGLPLFANLSCKLTLGTVSGGKPPAGRVAVSMAAALLAAKRGAFIMRVHDVQLTLEVI